MMFFRTVLLVCPAAFLLAQAPTPQANPSTATPIPKPAVTLTPMAPTVAQAPAVPPDKVIISVGDQKITAGQFDQIIASLPAQYQAQMRGPGRKQFADNVVRILVLAQEGRRRKLDAQPRFQTQVMFQTDNILAGMTYEDLGKDVKIDDADIKKYYDEHQKDFDEVHARHILIRMKGSPLPVKPGQKDLTEEEALAKAQEVWQKLKTGEDFATLAKQESDDTGTGTNGGDLGFFHHNQMVPAFADAAFQLKPGETSQPVKTQFGYHIIRVEAIKGYPDVKADVEKKMRPDAAAKALEALQKSSGVELDPQYFGASTPPPPPPVRAPLTAPPAK
jgi:peptidyl-prolyl cis-trans isomerase C